MADTLNEAQVRHVAQLARLKLSDTDVPRLSRQISSILDYVAQLQEANVEGLEPMAHPLPLHSVLREDEVRPSLTVQQVLANAPGKVGAFFTVPKVLDTGLGGG
ncbi:MAG: Asp-tRNA(Asn)/Glu-tRNA(Gln) amidotransferase subunit GatC [Planctomycetes bacterium]|jgi:aspartyl-tRNA(Asn)/glutamyl-tRNA(Gln) amidotransferase subunit C|nr:Asp-tRNA(Asn)/Glu-tRNA(Gln) amidotransferase subunit GatC [Planctomycetota bacterium]MDA8377263.1 Asp-tRNA(Asn)/Glu-tRNA(Gln) amidotransferase subunit GatC [Planctomycetia bacterium]